jgi:hypothetical protein
LYNIKREKIKEKAQQAQLEVWQALGVLLVVDTA